MLHLAYLGVDALLRLSNGVNAIPTLPEGPRCVCTGCVYWKITSKPFPLVPDSSRATSILEIIQSDIAGPIDPVSRGGSPYLLLFMDDFTRYKVGYTLKKNSEALKCFKGYKVRVETQHGLHLEKPWTDAGGEYTSNEFCHFLHEEGIEAQRMTPYTPQSNGVCQSANRTIIGTTHLLIQAICGPKEF